MRSLILALSVGVAAHAATVGQQPMFKARLEMVRVDALVTDHGKPVPGLQAKDFDLRDNGVPQEVQLVAVDETPINAILALDVSGSVAGERLTQLREAGRVLVGALRADDRAALITFSHAVRVRASLTTDLPSVMMALGGPGGRGGTALIDAIYAALVHGETETGRSLVIAFSDGVDTSSWLTPEAARDTARRSGTVLYGVAVAGQGVSFLKDVTADTGGAVISVKSTRDLGDVFVRVLQEFRQRYLVSFTPKGVAPTGWHRLDVRVKTRGGLQVKARPGYQIGARELN